MSSNMAAQSTISSERGEGLPPPQRRVLRFAVLALLCVMLAIVGSIVWYVNRPLTDVEQRLVGTWRNTTTPAAVFTFHSNRTVTDARFPPGRWSVHGNRLYCGDAPIFEALRMLSRNRVDDSLELTFEGEDSISVVAPLNGGTVKWQRVSP